MDFQEVSVSFKVCKCKTVKSEAHPELRAERLNVSETLNFHLTGEVPEQRGEERGFICFYWFLMTTNLYRSP